MSMQQSTELIIFVTHVEAEDSFLKIWGQVDKTSATCVERMILPLVEQFARSQGCVGPQLANLCINALCCARFQNEGYYRAKVINIRPDGMIVLQFIDYGNIEVLPPQEIHLLESIPGAESLQSFPPVAFEFTLMHLLPVNGVWDNNIIESIKKTLWYNEYKILINSVVNNHRFIKLCYNNEDFSELLIKRHMAIGATLQEMFRPSCVQQVQAPIYQHPNKHLVSHNSTTVTCAQNMKPMRCEENEMRGFQRNVPLCCAAQPKYTTTSAQEALVFKSRVLDVPSKHDVYVSFVEDGPQKFSVQLQSTSQILSLLMTEINSHPIEPLQEPPLPGSVCLGRYTHDKVLCRAVVMSVMENKCKLYYVDFGHTEVLSYTDIFQLPPHFINPRVLSIRFTLSGVHELNVADEMKEYFKQIVSRKLLLLHVRPPEGPPLVQYGDLYDDGKNIKDILRQAFPVPIAVTPTSPSFAYQEPKKLSKGMEDIVHVSFVESCKKFFVQLESGIKPLELIMNNLADFCANAPNISQAQLKIGLPCAALYDNQWYRAQILGINTDNIKVLYVDYGNEETMPLMSLRLLRDDLVKKLHAQAIRCSLNGWELVPSTQEVNNKFESLILEERLHLRVVDVNLDGVVVDLYEPETMENIKSQMLHTFGNEKKIVNESPPYQTMENQHSTKPTSNCNLRSYIKLQMNLVQQRKNKINIEASRESTNKWHKKNQSDSWYQTQNLNSGQEVQERNKFKTWKDDTNEGNVHENRNEKSNFHRNESRNERFNRDDFSNSRGSKDKWNNRNDNDSKYNDSFKSGRRGGTRGGRNKSSGYMNKSQSSEKSWSDKDSDTSSKGSGRRGKGGGYRGGYNKREGFSGRIQNNKFSERNDGSFRGGRTNSDSNYGNNSFKDRKGQGYRITQNRTNNFGSESDGEPRRNSPMKNRRELHIPLPNITVGTAKTCEVVFTNNLSDFFIQLSTDYVALDSLMENIASAYENGGNLMKESEILCGVYCIAQYSGDLKWYRAVIKSVKGNDATVQFVDYGNTEKVSFNNIKSIKTEFSKLPIQAIHCKLFGIHDRSSDKSKTQYFEDTVAGKTLEAEFITEENGVYSVLMKEVVNNSPASTFVNEEFCNGVDLLKAKEDAIPNRTAANTVQSNEPEYAPSDAKWATTSYTSGTQKDVIVTWFTNPNNFYCQVLDSKSEFRTMMNEIQKIYVGRKSASHMLQIGSPVIAVFADDGALYRAEVVELNKLNGCLIQYVDFGNSAVVESRKIYPVEKKLLHLPKQAVQCSLLNIVPQDGLTWSKANANAIDSCFNADKYECVFHDIKDNKCIISLTNNGIDVSKMLIEKNLASIDEATKPGAVAEDNTTKTATVSCNVERVDINLLSGQILRVKVSSVEHASKFYIQLSSTGECESMINTYMANKDPKVMQRLSAHEICLGTGCLVYSNGVWNRAVINSHSESTGFDVKFIDTGAYDEIFSDSVLALPGELSIMQNQAHECSLENVVSTPELDATLKERIEGTEIIIYINEVENNTLIVKLFELSGDKINISEDSDEKILPICPMPILSSTHKVSVSYADHSASIWLQRNTDYALDKDLIGALDQYYSTSGASVEPKVDLLCAVKSIDGHWYRAKIIKLTEIGAYVNFIDYGNNEEVTPDVVMSLDPRFYTPHQLAINVSLPVTLNGTVSEQLDILQNYLSNKELTGVFHNVNKKWVVELLHDGDKFSDKFRSLNSASQQETSEAKAPHVHNMTVGCTYDVYVSHVDSPSQFWLQYADDAADLSDKQVELQAEASKFSEVDEILEEGSLCVAEYTIDNLWYRAQVLDADEDITTVRFIDYGNTDVIANKTGNLRQIPDSWKEMKDYAIKCRLDVIPVDSEDWDVATCEKFENLVASVESMQAVVVANSVPKRVDLLINDKSVSEILVEDNHALKVHTEEELIDEIIDLELDPHSAFVSHVNSPSEFWVQEEKSVGDLEVMTDRFIVADMFPKVDEITENLLCVAKYPDDDSWYRARVISHSDNATRVIYIDYGNSATSTEVRAIPADLSDIPPLSRKCHLVMPEGVTEWSEKACKEFTKLAADGATIFLLDVLKEDEISLVKLTLNGKNVTDILADFCERFPSISEERLPPLGEENSPNVFISRIYSPDEFWIQTESSSTDLNMMLDKLQAAPSFLPLSTFKTGTTCAANYSDDDKWYRAKILSHSEHGTEVLYIDYGNTEITNETRMLPVDIINIPPLAKRCALQKPSIINCWPAEVCKDFKDLSADGETMFQFEILDDTSDPMFVKLSLNGKNIVDILVPSAESESQVNIVENNMEEDFPEEENISREIGEDTMGAQVIRSEEDAASCTQESNEGVDNSHLDAKAVVELTVDEIVQNMKIDEPADDEKTSKNHGNANEADEESNKDEVVKNLEMEIDTRSKDDRAETKDMIEEVLSNVTEKMTLGTHSNSSTEVENIEKEDDILSSERRESNSETVISDSSTYTKIPDCENLTEANTSQMEIPQSSNRREICGSNTDTKIPDCENLSEANTSLLEKRESSNEIEICESNIDTKITDCENVTQAKTSQLEKKESNTETKVCESNADTKIPHCENLIHENTSQMEIQESSNEIEICESNADMKIPDCENVTQANKSQLEGQESNTETKICESNANAKISDNENPAEVNTSKLEAPYKESIEAQTEVNNSSINKELDIANVIEQEKDDTKDYKIENSDKVDDLNIRGLNIVDTKDYCEVKGVAEKVYLDSQSVEIGEKECKNNDKETTVSLTNVLNVEKVRENNDAKVSLQPEYTDKETTVSLPNASNVEKVRDRDDAEVSLQSENTSTSE